MNTDSSAERPIFMLCTARSGSTLVRTLLNAHPDIACPSESNLLAAFEAAHFTMENALGDECEGAAVEVCRDIARRSLGAVASRDGKRRWCDKSLYSVQNPALLAKVFPEAQFICLYRDPLDTIASLMEASKWGYTSYGLEPYVQAHLGNIVNACAALWVDKVQKILVAEHRLGAAACRVRYETLIGEPETTLGRLWDWLDVSRAPSAAAEMFRSRRESTRGLGDYKLRFTEGFDPRSVGRGWTIPTELIAPDLADQIDEMNTIIGYPSLRAIERLTKHMNGSIDLAVAQAAETLIEEMAASSATTGGHRLSIMARSEQPIGVVISDVGLTRRFDRNGAIGVQSLVDDCGCLIVTDAETLFGLASGNVHPATALRSARLRVIDQGLHDDQQLLAVLDWFVESLAARAGQQQFESPSFPAVLPSSE